jgi:Fe2+ transport system protein B
MKSKTFILTAAIIFGIVAVLHLLRAINGLPLIIGIWEAPIWLSWLAFVVAGLMSYFGFKLACKKK